MLCFSNSLRQIVKTKVSFDAELNEFFRRTYGPIASLRTKTSKLNNFVLEYWITILTGAFLFLSGINVNYKSVM